RTWMFFFFQAEDGIRDATVTGVQTCALPISVVAVFDVLFYYEDLVKNRYDGEWCFEHMLFIYAWTWRLFYVWDLIEESDAFSDRSEERRVGKESRWSVWGG